MGVAYCGFIGVCVEVCYLRKEGSGALLHGGNCGKELVEAESS